MMDTFDPYKYFRTGYVSCYPGGEKGLPQQYLEDIEDTMRKFRNGRKLDGWSDEQIDDKFGEFFKSLTYSLRGRTLRRPSVPNELRERIMSGRGGDVSLELGRYREPIQNLQQSYWDEWTAVLNSFGMIMNAFYEEARSYVDNGNINYTVRYTKTAGGKTPVYIGAEYDLIEGRNTYQDFNFEIIIDKLILIRDRLSGTNYSLDQRSQDWEGISSSSLELKSPGTVKKLGNKAKTLSDDLVDLINHLQIVQAKNDKFAKIGGRFASDSTRDKWFNKKNTKLNGDGFNCFTIYYENCIELLKASQSALNIVREVEKQDEYKAPEKELFKVSNEVSQGTVEQLRSKIKNSFANFKDFPTTPVLYDYAGRKGKPDEKNWRDRELRMHNALLKAVKEQW